MLIVVPMSVLVLVFGIAVIYKLGPAGLRDFDRGIGELWFGPGELSAAARRRLAHLMLVAEIAVTAALVGSSVLIVVSGSVWAVPGFAVATALLGVFVVAHAIAAARGRSVRCACFGRLKATAGPLGLLRTALLLVVAGTGLALALVTPGGVDLAVALVGVPAGVVIGLLLVSLEDVVALFRSASASPKWGVGR